MKKEVLLISIVFCFVLGLFSIINLVSAAPGAVLSEINSTMALVAVVNAADMYSYEITLNCSGTVGTVLSYKFLGSSSDVTDIATSERSGLTSVYESILNSTRAGVSGSGNLFNVTHTGTISLSGAVFLDTAGTETTVDYTPATPVVTIVTVTTTSSGGGGTTVQHYSLKVVSPGEIGRAHV